MPRVENRQVEIRTIKENFSRQYTGLDHIVWPGHVRELLSRQCAASHEVNQVSPIYQPVIDDTVFVVCWYGSKQWSELLKNRTNNGEHLYLHREEWYRFVFFDSGFMNCQHPLMARRLVEEATYERWADWGVLYGFSRYGLVCLSATDWFPYNILRHHMRKQYATLALILLVQRAGLLKFSERVSAISHQIVSSAQAGKRLPAKKQPDIGGEVERLRGDFVHFLSHYWFHEVTPQEQGLEMYRLGQRIMNLKDDLGEMQRKVEALESYVRLVAEKKEKRFLDNIQILGLPFLVLTVVIGFWGMNMAVDLIKLASWREVFEWTILPALVITIMIWISLKYWPRR